jgi:hypothetical protein
MQPLVLGVASLSGFTISSTPIMTEQEIIEGLKTRDVQAFKALVQDYSEQITIYAWTLTKSRDMAAIICDTVLIDAWNKVIVLSEPIQLSLNKHIREACGFEGFNRQ